MRPRSAILSLLLLAAPCAAQDAAQGGEEAEALALLQQLFNRPGRDPEAARRAASLMNSSVVSASNRLEQLWGAPAQVVVLTREDLARRGYRDLTDALDDLPGMDLARHYGDDNFKNYMRGYRNTQGDPYLVLVDGRASNDLWLMQGQHALAAFPLSAVERVEVAYGPTSVLYGPNAMMGVVNIVTVANQAQDGTRVWGGLGAGNLARRGADLTSFTKRGDLRLRVAVKTSDQRQDERGTDGYEYTKAAYLRDPRIWAPGFLTGLDLQDPPWIRTRALDLSLAKGGTEVGLLYLRRESGYGVTYARDQIQRTGLWVQPALEAHLKHVQSFGDRLEGTTTVRWREDGFRPSSWDLEAYYDSASGAFQNRFSHWRTENRSVSVEQAFDWWVGWRWSLNLGLNWEHRDLQRGYDYDHAFHPVPQAVVPPPLPGTTPDANRDRFDVWGGYLQARFRLDDQQLLHLGFRRDRHPLFGDATSLRAGYTGRAGPFGLKLIYGEAIQEPSPRTLYGGFLQAGSNPYLKPERSRTWELVLSHGAGALSQTLDVYDVRNEDTVTYIRNLGTRRVLGADWSLQLRTRPAGLDELRVSAFLSTYLKADGTPAGDFGLDRAGHIADLSRNKAWMELAARRGPFQASLRGRYLSARDTVASNPLGRVSPAATVDGALTWSRGRLSLQAAVQNALDRRYAHPGIYTADAGSIPGGFVQDGQGATHWLGSGGAYDSAKGFYNSLLPQPGRTFQLTLGFRP